MEKKMITKHERVTTYSVGNRKFEMLKANVDELGVRYFAIDHKYIDKNWKLTKELNGLEMCMSESFEKCVETVNRKIETEEFAKKHRCSAMVASMVVNGDGRMTLKQARKLEKDILALGGK